MAAVSVVTDSTASLAPGRADRAQMITVPLQVVLDGVSAAEACDGEIAGAGTTQVTGSAVAAALRAGRTVTTSRPSPETFAAAYRQAAEAGADAIVPVHLSRAVSGTYDAAVLAARGASIPVTVIDSRTLAMALGYAALAGADVAAAGGSTERVRAVVERRAAAASAFFCVDSLEHLRRGGRIGSAQALLGSALAVKPLLTVSNGTIQPLERVRTKTKAVARLAELALEAAVAAAAGDEAVDLAVHHLDDVQAAEELADRLHDLLKPVRPPAVELMVSELSAVLGVHVGPGTLGVIVSPRLS